MRLIPFSAAMKPLLFVLYVSGLYSLSTKRGKRCWNFWKNALNITIALTCFGSLLVSFGGHIYSVMISRTTESLYLASYLLGEMFLFVGFRCFGQTSFRQFLAEYETYQTKYCENEAKSRSVLVMTVLAVVFLVGDVVLCLYYIVSGYLDVQCNTLFSNLPEAVQKITCQPVLFAIGMFLSNQIFNVAFFLYLTVWRMLKVEANGVVKRLMEEDREKLNETAEVLAKIRLRHADLCHVIASANHFMRHILAAFYGAGLTCALLVIDGLVHNNIDLVSLVNMAALFLCFVLYLVVITLTGSALNLKMHEPVDFLFRLDVQRMTGKGSEIVSAFLSRVQGAPIGFNVYNLFTVDTSAIMMICGTILTYTLVIVQFQPLQLATSSSPERPPAVTSANTENLTYVNTTEM